MTRALDLVFIRVLLPRRDSDSDEKRETSKDFKEQVSLMEQLLASWHSLGSSSLLSRFLGSSVHFALEILSHRGEITLMVVTPRSYRASAEKLIIALYPDALIEAQEEVNIFENRSVVRGGELILRKSYYEPIKSYQKLESDPINGVFAALAKLREEESACIQIALTGMPDTWQENALKYEKKLAKSHGSSWFGFIGTLFQGMSADEHKVTESTGHETQREGIKEKAKKIGYTAQLRIVVTGQDSVSTGAVLDNISAAYAQYGSPGHNSLKLTHPKSFESFLAEYLRRSVIFFGSKVLSIEEIASLFHFPHSKYNRTAEIKWQNFKIVKAPVNLPIYGLLLGTNTYQGVTKQVFMKNEDRFRHFYVIGQTGTGKTTLLQVMARQDIRE